VQHRTALGNPVLPPGSTSSGWVKPPTEPYLAKSGDAADDKCWWCACETRAHLSKHCSRWKEQRVTVCREVCKATDKKQTARNTSMAWLSRDERCTAATCVEFLENTEIDLRLARAGSAHGKNGRPMEMTSRESLSGMSQGDESPRVRVKNGAAYTRKDRQAALGGLGRGVETVPRRGRGVAARCVALFFFVFLGDEGGRTGGLNSWPRPRRGSVYHHSKFNPSQSKAVTA
jgi:hypothetical protein